MAFDLLPRIPAGHHAAGLAMPSRPSNGRADRNTECLAASLQDNPPETTLQRPASEDPQSKACRSVLASRPSQHGKSEVS